MKFIEYLLPLKAIGKEAIREKNTRKGNISSLHTWWSRKPLTVTRAALYASLVPLSCNNQKNIETLQFIKELAKKDNLLNEHILEYAKKTIHAHFDGKNPRVLDPFAGGGSIPLEALRLGCETYSLDYNPIAILIQKCTLEYPQKYGDRLIKEVKKWGDWILIESYQELHEFFPQNDFGAQEEQILSYIWARTIPCQNVKCNIEIPLLGKFWLANNSKRRITLRPKIETSHEKNGVNFSIMSIDRAAEKSSNFDPTKGTVSKAIVECPRCKNRINAKQLSALFREKKSSIRMIAVVTEMPQKKGKHYRIATEKDIRGFKKATMKLKHLMEHQNNISMSLLPEEDLPPKNTLGFRVQRYGAKKWIDLFNARQQLVLLTFINKTRAALKKMQEEHNYEVDFARAVVSYLALAVSKLAEINCMQSHWDSSWEKISTTFSRHAFPMNWDFTEINPFSQRSYSYQKIIENITTVLTSLIKIQTPSATVVHGSATELPFPNNYFDVVITDPPYYDNIPYSYLSDFFYIWLKKMLYDVYPQLFLTDLTPKTKEIVEYQKITKKNGSNQTAFEMLLKKAFFEISRVLKNNGTAIIIFAHKNLYAWESLIEILHTTNLVITATWPLSTELKTRLRAHQSATLSSSIYIVARKKEKKEKILISSLIKELKTKMEKKLDILLRANISGADFFISGIGAGLEVIGSYKKTIDSTGKELSSLDLLEYVRTIITSFLSKRLFTKNYVVLTPLTRFYIIWRWLYQNLSINYDEARKLGHTLGIDLEEKNVSTLIRKEKGSIRVLEPQERKIETITENSELIDQLHYLLLQIYHNKKEQLYSHSNNLDMRLLKDLAQTICQLLPTRTKEKQLLEIFLSIDPHKSKE